MAYPTKWHDSQYEPTTNIMRGVGYAHNGATLPRAYKQWVLGWVLRPNSHMIPTLESQIWHGCLHDNTFWKWGLGLALWVGLSKKLDPTLKPSLTNIFLIKNQDPTSMITIIFEWSLEAHKWRLLSPRWDSLNMIGIWGPRRTGP